jgi:hypothetical protein
MAVNSGGAFQRRGERRIRFAPGQQGERSTLRHCGHGKWRPMVRAASVVAVPAGPRRAAPLETHARSRWAGSSFDGDFDERTPAPDEGEDSSRHRGWKYKCKADPRLQCARALPIAKDHD